MAQYKYSTHLHQNSHAEFDATHKPGEISANSGIYRCTGCGDEVAVNKGDPFPPQNHHQHAPSQGLIRWQLLVFAVQR